MLGEDDGAVVEDGVDPGDLRKNRDDQGNQHGTDQRSAPERPKRNGGLFGNRAAYFVKDGRGALGSVDFRQNMQRFRIARMLYKPAWTLRDGKKTEHED